MYAHYGLFFPLYSHLGQNEKFTMGKNMPIGKFQVLCTTKPNPRSDRHPNLHNTLQQIRNNSATHSSRSHGVLDRWNAGFLPKKLPLKSTKLFKNWAREGMKEFVGKRSPPRCKFLNTSTGVAWVHTHTAWMFIIWIFYNDQKSWQCRQSFSEYEIKLFEKKSFVSKKIIANPIKYFWCLFKANNRCWPVDSHLGWT